jgi:hypothetical protein
MAYPARIYEPEWTPLSFHCDANSANFVFSSVNNVRIMHGDWVSSTPDFRTTQPVIWTESRQ